jgi:predicted nucleic acid-binding protein
VSRSAAAGVVDAGVVLARLDRRRRSYARVTELFNRSARRDTTLYLSIVNLAEVLQHGRRYSEATGLDLVALLAAFRVELHRPDVGVARRVAELATLEDTSLADRFAAATAEALDARLYTTDSTLVTALRRRKVPVTRF